MDNLYSQVSHKCSEIITRNYSTSFSLGIVMFQKSIRQPIYSIYGFVRLADEIVDTYKGENRQQLLNEFRHETFQAIHRKVSLNPVLHAFQEVVNQYDILPEHIDAFLDSMEMDLNKEVHDQESYNRYIYGSAEVVGLMCLKIFCAGNADQYNKLESYAQSLGSAFQKVNFLRDMKSDYDDRGRVYFPDVDFDNFTMEDKQRIEAEKEAERKRLQKLAKAGDKAILKNWVDTMLINPVNGIKPESEAIAKLISEKFESFKVWANSEIEKM